MFSSSTELDDKNVIYLDDVSTWELVDFVPIPHIDDENVI